MRHRLYSEFDRRVGHHRRYSARALRRKLEQASFDVVEVRYVNLLGAVVWAVVAKLLRRTPTTRGSVLLFDRFGFPLVRRLERIFQPPLGQSIFAVAVARGPTSAARY